MLFIVCALPCEASSLISHFRLKPLNYSAAFPLYTSPTLALVVSGGVGKAFTAAAMGYAQGIIHPSSPTAWLNVGIAGHATLALGTGILAHQIVDCTQGCSYYPTFVIDRPVQTAAVWTVEQPEMIYEAKDAVYEMEAAAFWKVAARLTTAELIHCYKVISDNLVSPTCRLKAHDVEVLMRAHIPHIAQIVEALSALIQALADCEISPAEMEVFLQRWHFTATQQCKLKRMLQRWKACTLQPCTGLWDAELLAQPHSQQVLNYLDKRLANLPLTF